MPIDINRLRTERGGDPDAVRRDQEKRFMDPDVVDRVLALDQEWRCAQGEVEVVRMEMNALQARIKELRSAGRDFAAVSGERKALASRLPEKKKQADALKLAVDRELAGIGNAVDSTVPISCNEEDHVVVRRWDVPRQEQELHLHNEVLRRIGDYESDRGGTASGYHSRIFTGYCLLLEQALLTYAMVFLMENKHKLVKPACFVSKDETSDEGDEQFGIAIGEDEKWRLAAASEQSVCSYHKGEWVEESRLPLRYGSLSVCFREEVGSPGNDTQGNSRTRQLEQVEQVCITQPDESIEELDEMLRVSERFYQSLRIPYRVVNTVSGELADAATKQWVLEGWFPARKAFRALASASNCTDYHARAMGIRCGFKKANEREKKFVHTLSSTLCSPSRVVRCVAENFQDEGGVRVPEVLVPFMGGAAYLPFEASAQATATRKSARKKRSA